MLIGGCSSSASSSSSSVGPSRRSPSSSMKISLMDGAVLSAWTAAVTMNGPAWRIKKYEPRPGVGVLLARFMLMRLERSACEDGIRDGDRVALFAWSRTGHRGVRPAPGTESQACRRARCVSWRRPWPASCGTLLEMAGPPFSFHVPNAASSFGWSASRVGDVRRRRARRWTG